MPQLLHDLILFNLGMISLPIIRRIRLWFHFRRGKTWKLDSTDRFQ
jgi:hypothetical protein